MTAPTTRADTAARPAAGRRGLWRALTGALIVVGASVGFAGWQLAADNSTQVLVVVREVAVGQVIAAGDLRVAQVTLEPGISAVRAGQADQVIGRSAAVPLLPGTVLASDQVGLPVVPGPGRLVVALSVKTPPAGLARGSGVRILITPSITATVALAQDPEAAGLLTPAVNAAVVEIGEIDPSGARVISVLVSADDGERVAAAAASGTVSLVITAAR